MVESPTQPRRLSRVLAFLAIVMAVAIGKFAFQGAEVVEARGRGQDAFPPSIYYSLANNSTVYSFNLQVVISICHADGIASHSVTSPRGEVAPDAYATCGSGESGTAYFVTWHYDTNNELLLGANEVSISACSNWPSSECTMITASWTYALPVDPLVSARLLDSAMVLKRGVVDTVAAEFRNEEALQKTLDYSGRIKCTGGAAVCSPIGTQLVLPAKVGKVPGRDTLYVVVRHDEIGGGAVNIGACRLVGPPTTEICATALQLHVTMDDPSLPTFAGASVTPGTAGTNKGSATAFSLSFTVANTGGPTTTYALQPACDPAVIQAGCPSASTVTLSSGNSSVVTMNLTSATQSTLTTGTVSLTATAGTFAATGQTAVTVGPNGGTGGSPTILATLAKLNPGTSIARDQCLMVAAGDAAGVECGDLRLAHALPAMQTMGQSRAPTLVYSSRDARPIQLISANVTILRGAPMSITSTLTIGGEQVMRTHPVPSSCHNFTCRVVVPFDAEAPGLPGWGAFPTGLYPYTLQFSMVSGGLTYDTTPDTASLVIVNRTASPFGRGWWMEGVEELVLVNDSTKLWVGGDGSTRLYRRTSDTLVFLALNPVSRPDTLKNHGTYGWRRHLPNGAFVRFDNSGRHNYTANVLQHMTRLRYDGGRLDSILLPVPAGSSANPHYKFHYNGSGKIDSVRARMGTGSARTTRITRVTSATRDTMTITDPGDATGVKFAIDTTLRRITARRNRLGHVTNFEYDSLNAVAKTEIVVPSDSSIINRFCHASTRGLVGCGVGVGLVPLPLAVTSLDGPRGGTVHPHVDTRDRMIFHLNRFGGPDTIQDPLGGRTRLERDADFPALVTKVTSPTGLVQRATYNARGLVDTMWVDDPLGDAQNARTIIRWNSKWALPDTIRPPVGASIRFNYNTTVAKLNWQLVGPHDSTRVRFWYNGTNHWVDSTSQPGLKESFTYDPVLGNVIRARAADQVTVIGRDSIGREITIADSLGLLTETIFRNAMGRVDSTLAVSAAMQRPYQQPLTGPDTANKRRWNEVPSRGRRVLNAYDAEGNLLSVTREARETEHAFAAATTSWTYDAARRVRSRSDGGAADSMWYDPAGLLTKRKTPRGFTIVNTYDMGGRLASRLVPGVTVPQQLCSPCAPPSLPLWPSSYPYFLTTLPGGGTTTAFVAAPDVETFTYDAAGRLLTANNASARIKRSYYPGGALKTDTTRIGVWDPTDTLYVGTRYDQHVAGLGYEYDLAGRRTRRTDGGGWQQTYSYHDSLGTLAQTVSHAGGGDSVVFDFTWDAAQRLVRNRVVGASIAISDSNVYDAMGRLGARTVKGRNIYGPGMVFHDTYAYDSRGKQVQRVTTSEDLTLVDTSSNHYDGFGAVVAVERRRAYGGYGYALDEFDVDAFGNVWGSHQNRHTNENRRQVDHGYSGERLSTRSANRLGYVRASSGNGPAVAVLDSTESYHDASGNLIKSFSPQLVFSYYEPDGSGGFIDHFAQSPTGSEFSFYFYDAAERLRTSLRTSHGAPFQVQSEYRDDALGRRILVRSRSDSTCTTNCVGTIDWFTWDGDQILTEARGYHAWNAVNVEGSHASVAYVHALGIDDPLAVRKSGGMAFVPHRSGRGGFEAGTYVNGDPMDDYHWPQRRSGVYLAPDGRIEPIEPLGWYGSLLDGKTDPSGLQYMRNRYYDGASGRFTQRDPIGLAGGLNFYGYANGDPINGSDPFGLKVVFSGAEAEALWRQLMADARNARKSDDEGTRKAGALLFNTMRAIELHDHTFEINFIPFGSDKRRETGGGESLCLPVLLKCTVDVDSGTEPLAGRLTTLAHEAGGAWASKQRVGGHDDLLTGGIMYENAARRIYECGGFRSTHTPAQGPPPTYCR